MYPPHKSRGLAYILRTKDIERERESHIECVTHSQRNKYKEKYLAISPFNLPNSWQIFLKVVTTPFRLEAAINWSNKSLAIAEALFTGLLLDILR